MNVEYNIARIRTDAEQTINLHKSVVGPRKEGLRTRYYICDICEQPYPCDAVQHARQIIDAMKGLELYAMPEGAYARAVIAEMASHVKGQT